MPMAPEPGPALRVVKGLACADTYIDVSLLAVQAD